MIPQASIDDQITAADLPPEDAPAEAWLHVADRLRTARDRARSLKRLEHYRPYGKQIDFHTAGAMPVYERLFMAGNQLGKTLAGAAEMAMHLTGLYPSWWQGRRFDRAITALAGSESSELTRDGVQRLLVGPPANEEDWGTGFIPQHLILDTNRKSGVPDALDSVVVKHVAGGASTLHFKSYDQGRGKWQANTVDVVWFDEEPPPDVYSEGRTRTNATGGIVMLTFTPLLGMSEVVRRFLMEASPDRSVITMTIHDVDHYTEEARARIIRSYPEHERDARTSGIPILGSGRVFPLADSAIKCDPFPLPAHWVRIGGLDFGWDHPTAGVEMAWDRDADIVYITREHRQKQKPVDWHALVLKQWGEDLRWAWPHDGKAADKGTGDQLAKQYKKHGLKMLGEHATFTDGTNGREAGVLQMLERFMWGKMKVFSTCQMFFEEFRLYHRDEGVIVAEMDDLLSAARYAMMMLRHARTVQAARDPYGFYPERRAPVAQGTGEVW